MTTLMLGLCSCTSPGVGPDAIVGKTMGEVDNVLPDDATYMVQDVSTLFKAKPSYTESDFGSSRWTVVAACSSAASLEDSDTIELAVAPTDAVSESDRAAARDGEYASAVTCKF